MRQFILMFLFCSLVFPVAAETVIDKQGASSGGGGQAQVNTPTQSVDNKSNTQTIIEQPENNLNVKLPKVDLDQYANELAEYQKLQRENLILKLKSENKKLEKEQGKSGGDEEVSLIAVFFNRGSAKARVYDGQVRTVSVGDVVSKKYRLSKISRDYIELYSLDGGDEKKFKVYL